MIGNELPPLPPLSPQAAILREIGLFGGLPDEALEAVSRTLETVVLAPGSEMVHEGELGRDMFVLLDGEAEVVRHAPNQREARIAVLGPGDWFGEMSMIDLAPRSATVRTISAVRALHVTINDIKALYRRDAKSYALLVLNVARQLSRRLRVADGVIAEHVASYTTRPTV